MDFTDTVIHEVVAFVDKQMTALTDDPPAKQVLEATGDRFVENDLIPSVTSSELMETNPLTQTKGASQSLPSNLVTARQKVESSSPFIPTNLLDFVFGVLMSCTCLLFGCWSLNYY